MLCGAHSIRLTSKISCLSEIGARGPAAFFGIQIDFVVHIALDEASDLMITGCDAFIEDVGEGNGK